MAITQCLTWPFRLFRFLVVRRHKLPAFYTSDYLIYIDDFSQKVDTMTLKKGPCSQPMQHTQSGNHELKSNICSQRGKKNKEQEHKVSRPVQIHLLNWPANYLTVPLLFPLVLLGKFH